MSRKYEQSKVEPCSAVSIVPSFQELQVSDDQQLKPRYVVAIACIEERCRELETRYPIHAKT
jgi:hypothetical protein